MPSRDLDAEAAAAEREKAMKEWRKSADDELHAMDQVFQALYQLPRDVRQRVMKWAEACLEKSPYYGEPPF